MDELMNIPLLENLEVAEIDNENVRVPRTPHNPFHTDLSTFKQEF
jgi:hypothetical protein